MKIFKYVVMACVALTTMSSCLKANLEDLPTYDESRITDIRFDYRYYGPNEWVDGEHVVEYVELKTVDKKIDKEALTVTCRVQVPKASGSFTAEEKAKVSKSNLSGILWVSTAARVTPLNGSAVLGVPGDWTKANTYQVKAANGSQSIWTITVLSVEQL
ncbi:MAG: hypothetical protein RR980_01555 [Mucinivorans sp.]